MNTSVEVSQVTDSRRRRRIDEKKRQPSLVKCENLVPDSRKWKKRGKNKSKSQSSSSSSSLEKYCKSVNPPLDWNSYFPSSETNFDLKVPTVKFESKPTYPRRILKKNPLKVVKGMRLEKDVVSLLSNGGKRDYLVRNNGAKVPVDSIAGKYLLICCFMVPLLTEEHAANTCRAMITAYSQLSANYNTNFEMVMVAKMTTSPTMEAEEEAAFNRFFAAFPCLAIPFSDTKSRDTVCYSVGLTDPWLHYSALVLDPDQTVLQTEGSCFLKYGAAGFPFDSHRLDALSKQDSEIQYRLDFDFNWKNLQSVASCPPVSLVQLLGSHLLFKSGDNKVITTVSDLGKSSKYVGLYLCCDGLFMETLNRIHQMCIAQDLEFEIVLIYLPVKGDTPSFVSYVNSALEMHRISSWWVMPFVDEVSRRLWRLCYLFRNDSLIIWGEGGNFAEFYGRQVINLLGETWYPFARKTITDDIFSRLRSLNLESLLGGVDGYLIQSSRTGCDDGIVHVPVSDFKNRKVLLYLDWYDSISRGPGGGAYKLMCSSYEGIKERFPCSEVVYVPLDLSCPPDEWRPQPAMPWLMLPIDAAIQGEVVKRLFPEGNHTERTTFLIAFGEDGLIRSRYALDRLIYSMEPPLFADTLFEEIAGDLAAFYEHGFQV